MRDIGEEDHLGLIDLLVGLPAHDFEFKLPRQPDADAHQIDGQYAERREQQRIPDIGRGAAPPCLGRTTMSICAGASLQMLS